MPVSVGGVEVGGYVSVEVKLISSLCVCICVCVCVNCQNAVLTRYQVHKFPYF